MTPHLKAIDAQMALRIYGAAIGLTGVAVLGMGFADSTVFGTPVLATIFGTMLIVAGCWSASLSHIKDQALRRKGLMWFLAAHYFVLNVVSADRKDIWGPTSQTVNELLRIANLGIGISLLGTIMSLLGKTFEGPKRSDYEKQMREAGAQEERNRLARDLHDSIKQQIFVIQTAAATAQTRFNEDRTGASQAIRVWWKR